MTTSIVRTTGGVAATLLLAAGAFAQPFGGEGGSRPGPEGAARFLELSHQQREAARQIREQRRPEMQALHERMRENRERLRESLESGAADPTAVGELVIEGHALRQKGRVLREESKSAFEALLTPEQLRKLELMEAARAAGKPGRGPRGRGRPGGGGAPGAEPDQE